MKTGHCLIDHSSIPFIISSKKIIFGNCPWRHPSQLNAIILINLKTNLVMVTSITTKYTIILSSKNNHSHSVVNRAHYLKRIESKFLWGILSNICLSHECTPTVLSTKSRTSNNKTTQSIYMPKAFTLIVQKQWTVTPISPGQPPAGGTGVWSYRRRVYLSQAPAIGAVERLIWRSRSKVGTATVYRRRRLPEKAWR